MSLPIDPTSQYPDPAEADESSAGLRLVDHRQPDSHDGRTTPVQFLREVQGELRKVAWPSRSQLINYSAVVLITLVFIVGLIFGLNIAFQHLVGYLLTP